MRKKQMLFQVDDLDFTGAWIDPSCGELAPELKLYRAVLMRAILDLQSSEYMVEKGMRILVEPPEDEEALERYKALGGEGFYSGTKPFIDPMYDTESDLSSFKKKRAPGRWIKGLMYLNCNQASIWWFTEWFIGGGYHKMKYPMFSFPWICAALNIDALRVLKGLKEKGLIKSE